MSLIKYIGSSYLKSTDPTTIVNFSKLSDQDQGLFLVNQLLAVRHTSPSFDIVDSDVMLSTYLSDLRACYDYYSRMPKVNPFSLRILSIVQSMLDIIILPNDIKWSDLVYIVDCSHTSMGDPHMSEHVGDGKNDLILAYWFMYSKINQIQSFTQNYSPVAIATYFTDHPSEDITITLPNAIMYTPRITKAYTESSFEDIDACCYDADTDGFSIRLSKMRLPTDSVTISLSSVAGDKYAYNVLEQIISNTQWGSGDFINILLLLSMFRLTPGNCEWSNDLSIIRSYLFDNELQVEREFNIVYYIANKRPATYVLSVFMRKFLSDMISKFDLDVSNHSMFLSTNNIDRVMGGNNIESVVKNTIISSETISLVKSTDKLIHKLTMEDEAPEEESDDTEEEAEPEEDTSSDDEDFSDDSGADEDSSWDDNSGDSSYSDSSYSSGGGGSEDQALQIPKNENANTSNKKGIKLELDVNPTLDSILFKDELSNLITNLVNDGKISEFQKDLLKNVKLKWIGLLSVDSLIELVERILKRNIFKNN